MSPMSPLAARHIHCMPMPDDAGRQPRKRARHSEAKKKKTKTQTKTKQKLKKEDKLRLHYVMYNSRVQQE